MLSLYRRHQADCPHKAKGRGYTRCLCTIWAEGTHPVTRKRLQRSTGLYKWDEAEQLLTTWGSDPQTPLHPPSVSTPSLKEAIAQYLLDCKIRKLVPSTICLYQGVLEKLSKSIKVTELSQITPGIITQFRNSHISHTANSIRIYITIIKIFFNFCISQDWITRNPCKGVGRPAAETGNTLPFTPLEITQLVSAIPPSDLPLKAAIYLMLYSGLRISDIMRLRHSDITSDGKLIKIQHKTKNVVYVKLPSEVLDLLARLRSTGTDYYFYNAQSTIQNHSWVLRQKLNKLGKQTNLHIHPHRFRDTFSVFLLNSGASLRTVQYLLGHNSIKTTETHYAPFVGEYQQVLDAATAKLRF